MTAFLIVQDVRAAGSDDLRGWSWSSTIGWTSLNCINLDSCPPTGIDYGIDFDAAGAVNYRVTVNFITGAVTGWSWNGNDDGTGVGWMDWSYANILLSETICDNGLDDEGDGAVDCADKDCDLLQGGTVLGVPVFCHL